MAQSYHSQILHPSKVPSKAQAPQQHTSQTATWGTGRRSMDEGPESYGGQRGLWPFGRMDFWRRRGKSESQDDNLNGWDRRARRARRAEAFFWNPDEQTENITGDTKSITNNKVDSRTSLKDDRENQEMSNLVHLLQLERDTVAPERPDRPKHRATINGNLEMITKLDLRDEKDQKDQKDQKNHDVQDFQEIQDDQEDRDDFSLPKPAQEVKATRAEALNISSAHQAVSVAGFCTRCTDCIKVVLRSGFTNSRYGSASRNGHHHATLGHINKAGESGCQLCRSVSLFLGMDKLSIAQNEDVDQFKGQYGTFDIVRFSAHEIETWRISIIIDGKLANRTTHWEQSLWLHPAISNNFSDLNSQPIIESSTGSASSVLHMKNWIKSCDETHSTCAAGRKTRSLPTRLIEVQDQYERLVFSKDIILEEGARLKYVTLSHCWGQYKMFTLQNNNISSLLEEIPREKLTKTFLDTIDVTRKLGFKYLWIDSLCIIQDDLDDWKNESILMSNVYGGSSLTIAATGAKDGSYGCYSDREPSAISSQKLQISIDGVSKQYDCYNFDIYKQGIMESPLAQRAWAMQERFLTTRTIHFTSQQLIWECGERFACETFPEEMPIPLATQHGWFRRRKNNPNIWVETVSQYSNCLLTKGDDKLIAIAGIARWLQEQTGDEYIYGLWWKNIEHQLLWQVEEGFSGTRPEKYRAPSWSWASVDGPIKWNLWAGLSLKNFVLVASLEQIVDGSIVDMHVTVASQKAMRLRCQGVMDYNSARAILDDVYRLDAQWDHMADSDSGELTEVYVLPITIRAPRRAIECLAAGLLLQSTGLKGQYKRVGMFRAVFQSAQFSLDSPSLMPPITDPERYEWAGGDTKSRKKEYIISIV